MDNFLGYIIIYLVLSLVFSSFFYGFKYFIFVWLKKGVFNMIILENIFFGFWTVLGGYFIFCLAFGILISIFATLFDLFIPR